MITRWSRAHGRELLQQYGIATLIVGKYIIAKTMRQSHG